MESLETILIDLKYELIDFLSGPISREDREKTEESIREIDKRMFQITEEKKNHINGVRAA